MFVSYIFDPLAITGQLSPAGLSLISARKGVCPKLFK